jgi:hypothetical protein
MDLSLEPTGWELAGRIVVIVGLAGLLGLCARLTAGWLRKRIEDRAARKRMD